MRAEKSCQVRLTVVRCMRFFEDACNGFVSASVLFSGKQFHYYYRLLHLGYVYLAAKFVITGNFSSLNNHFWYFNLMRSILQLAYDIYRRMKKC